MRDEDEYGDQQFDESVVTELAEPESWDMLKEFEFGRLAYHLMNEVHIVPINYCVCDDRLLFRTAEGSKFLGVNMNADVAFEIDDVEDEVARSVVLRGKARTLEGDEARLAEALPLRPWVPTAKYNIVAIEPTEITGRRFRLDRPWLHMRPSTSEI